MSECVRVCVRVCVCVCVCVCCLSVSLFSILDVFNCQQYIHAGQDHLKCMNPGYRFIKYSYYYSVNRSLYKLC